MVTMAVQLTLEALVILIVLQSRRLLVRLLGCLHKVTAESLCDLLYCYPIERETENLTTTPGVADHNDSNTSPMFSKFKSLKLKPFLRLTIQCMSQ